MGRHSFMQMSKLSNVKGKIDYISNPDRQENLYGVYETNARPFWKELAKENRADFKRSGSAGQCIEARELIIALTENYMDYDPIEVLKKFTDYFKNQYGVECSSALHYNKKRSNYHIHLIFSERKLLPEPIEKIATRNMYYDEKGRHVHTKKEVLDANGKIRKGCTVILKGQPYERHLFQKKNPRLKEKSFLEEVKQSYTELINEWVFDDREKLSVYQKNSCYLPTKKIGKNNPKGREIEADNRARIKWNQSMDQAMQVGIPKESLIEMKKTEIILPIKESIDQGGKQPKLFRNLVSKAAKVVLRIAHEWMKLPEEIRKEVIENKFKEITMWAKDIVNKQSKKEDRSR